MSCKQRLCTFSVMFPHEKCDVFQCCCGLEYFMEPTKREAENFSISMTDLQLLKINMNTNSYITNKSFWKHFIYCVTQCEYLINVTNEAAAVSRHQCTKQKIYCNRAMRKIYLLKQREVYVITIYMWNYGLEIMWCTPNLWTSL